MLEWLLSKWQQITNAVKDVEKRNPCALLVGMSVAAATIENIMKVPQELKIEQAYDPAIRLLAVYPKEKTLIWRDICTYCSLQHYLQ